ncbi:MAG: PIN/TRAM domain-containing protein [Phycisphaerales bacterium JB040]
MSEPVEGQEVASAGTGSGRAVSAYEAAVNRRAVLVRVVRIGFSILFAVVTGLALIGGPLAGRDSALVWQQTLIAAIVVAAIVVTIDLLTPEKKISTVVSVVVGLLAAMLAAAALGFIIDLLAATYGDINMDNPPPLLNIIKILMGTGLAYLAISTVVQTQDDLRLVIPYVEFAKQIRGQRPLILDTSSLVDGRMLGVVESGLVQAPMLIPRFVLEELHRLSDSADKLKRARGRRGLDMVSKLQRSSRADITIDETPIPGNAVDQMLIELGRQSTGVIVTTDSGLERVAGIEGVGVVNLHDVASALRQTVVPGESIRVRLVKRGEQAGQGVGYLEDGTMVVAEDGEEAIGDEVELVVQTSLQTSGGRMIFARIGDGIAPVAGAEGADDDTAEDASDPRADATEDSGQAPDRVSNGAGAPGGSPGPRVVKRVGRNPRR